MAWYTYKVAETSLGASDAPPVTSVVGLSDGKVAVAYSADGKLNYSFLNGSNSWQGYTILFDRVAPYAEVKMILVDEYPAVAFYRTENVGVDLAYVGFVRASNLEGSSWMVPSEIKTFPTGTFNPNSDFGIGMAYEDDGNNTIVSYIGYYSGDHDFSFSESLDRGSSWWYNYSSCIASWKTLASFRRGTALGFLVFTDTYGSIIYSLAEDLTHMRGTVDNSVTSANLVAIDTQSTSYFNPVVFYTDSNSIKAKIAENSSGSSWPASSTTIANSLASGGTRRASGAYLPADDETGIVYRKTDGIYFYKGYTIRIVDTSNAVGNFGIAEVNSNVVVSYYFYNSSSGKYEVWIASDVDLGVDESESSASIFSESSSSIEEEEYKYSYFDNGDGGNMLNQNGNMTGNTFIFPETVNVCSLWAYSGDDIHNLKLEDVDNGRILCDLPKWGQEQRFSSVTASTRLRVIVNDGSPGDIVNSYEVKFRFDSGDNSSSVTETESSYSTESSESTSSQTESTSSSSTSTQTVSTSSESSVSTSSVTISTSSTFSSASSASSKSSQTISTSSSVSSSESFLSLSSPSSSTQIRSTSSSLSSSSLSSNSSSSSSSISSSSLSSSTQAMTSSQSSSSESSSSVSSGSSESSSSESSSSVSSSSSSSEI